MQVVDLLVTRVHEAATHPLPLLSLSANATQVVDLLVRLYREAATHSATSPVVLAVADGRAASGPSAAGANEHPLDRGPVLAATLAHLAQRAQQQPGGSLRRDLRRQLLSLFVDLAGQVGSRDPQVRA